MNHTSSVPFSLAHQAEDKRLMQERFEKLDKKVFFSLFFVAGEEC